MLQKVPSQPKNQPSQPGQVDHIFEQHVGHVHANDEEGKSTSVLSHLVHLWADVCWNRESESKPSGYPKKTTLQIPLNGVMTIPEKNEKLDIFPKPNSVDHAYAEDQAVCRTRDATNFCQHQQ